jgi:hypothetical protein
MKETKRENERKKEKKRTIDTFIFDPIRLVSPPRKIRQRTRPAHALPQHPQRLQLLKIFQTRPEIAAQAIFTHVQFL